MKITFDIQRLVPRYIYNDKNGHALAKAIERAFQYVADATHEGIDIIQDPDKMPEWRLDEMALELNCLYDFSDSLENKRIWIKNAGYMYSVYGTKGAIINYLGGIFGDMKVEEWWEYDGLPYHFRVQTNNTSSILRRRERFLRLLNIVKNVRSVLDNVYYYGESAPAKGYAATRMYAMIGRAASPLAMRQTSDHGEATARGFAATRVWAAAMRRVLPVLAAPDVQRAALRDDQGGMVLDSTGFPIMGEKRSRSD